MNESQFETELIQFITTGTITNLEDLDGIPEFQTGCIENKVIKTKLWKYEKNIKTTEQLWDNFKKYLSSIIKMC